VAQAYLDQMVRSRRILNDRAQQIQGVLNGGSAMAMTNLAAELEADVVQIQAGQLGGDADRMAKLATVLRGIAMQQ
jgi:hypothetical protein